MENRKTLIETNNMKTSFIKRTLGYIDLLDNSDSLDIGDVKMCVTEALQNILDHSNPNSSQPKWARVSFLEKAGHLVISIDDQGVGIGDIQKAQTPHYTTSRNEKNAGIGFSVMKSFCHKLSIYSLPGQGTNITLEWQWSK